MTSSAHSIDRRRWIALALVVAAQFMVVLDIAIVNVALPSIGKDLDFSAANLQWVVSAYAILFGGFLLLGGRLGDIFGRRRLFVAGLALFAFASLLCGLSWSEGSLIAFRGLQGLGGALLAPATLSILMTTFAEGPERNLALGIWGAVSGSGAAAGVLLGGLLTSYLSWSWIFFINVPIGLTVIALAPLALHESRIRPERRHFDLAGAITVTTGVMLLVYAMTRATQDGWTSTATVGLLAGAAAFLTGFVAVEARSPAPLLPLRIFRVRTLAAANATAAVIMAIAFSQFLLLTLYMQQVLGYSAVETGVAFVAITLTIMIVSNVAQALVTRVGPGPVLVVGLALDAAGLAGFARLPVDGRYFWDLFPAFMVSGVGLALSFVPVTIAGLAGVRRSDAGVASGLINTSRQVGGALGLAAATTIAAAATPGTSGAVTAAGLTHGFHVAFWALAGLGLVGVLIAAAFIVPGAGAAAAEPLTREPVLEEAA